MPHRRVPSIGRIVHYVANLNTEGNPGEHWAAIITEANDKYVGLLVFSPLGITINPNTPYDQNADRGGTWHWPEYVAPRNDEPQPSLGRIVHYISHGSPNGEYPAGVHRAAIITSVSASPLFDDNATPGIKVGLCVFNPTGVYLNAFVPYDPTATQAGSWHWPETATPLEQAAEVLANTAGLLSPADANATVE